MPNIPALTQFTANTRAKASEVNGNFSTLRTTLNSYGLFSDVNATVTGTYTFNTAPVFTAAPTFAAGVSLGGQLVISSGGASITGNSTITGTLATSGAMTSGGGLTVSSGGALITGNSSISGTLATTSTASVGSTLTVSAGGIAVTGNSTVTGNLTVTGTVTAAGLSGPTAVAASNVSPGTFQAGSYTFQSGLSITGTATATTFSGAFSGSGASLTGIPISGVTSLQTSLDGKAATSHTHAASQITAGTFGTGSYVFPSSVTVSTTLTATSGVVAGGATFTGSLSGTSATFSGTCSASGYSIVNDATTRTVMTIYANAYTTGSGSPAAMSAAPVTSGTGNWVWMRINFNGTNGYVPILY